MKCWGSNYFGQLGLGDTTYRGDGAGEMGASLPAVDVGSGTVVSLAAGGFHTCVLLENGRVKCWGLNSMGQLGLGLTDNQGEDGFAGDTTLGDQAGEMGDNLATLDFGTGRTVTAVSANLYHSCVVLDNGSVKCWGRNDQGQLGVGDTNNRGDAPGEMGDSLPAITFGRPAVTVTTGASHSCALLNDGSVKCWGYNFYGQLGLGHANNVGDQPGETTSLVSVDLGTGRTALSVAAGGDHTCAVLDDNTLKCWGRNDFGELGLGHTEHVGNDPDEMGNALAAVSLGAGRTAAGVTSAYSHTCAVLDDKTVKCWGYNQFGNLGVGDTSERGDEAGEMGDALSTVSLGTGKQAAELSAGSYYTCSLFDDAAIKCWGLNSSGQLGLGDRAWRGDQPSDMGDNLPAVSLE